jgi:HSP20 family protein
VPAIFFSLALGVNYSHLRRRGYEMAIVRWDPFRNLTTLQDRINRLFWESFPESRREEDASGMGMWQPLVDIHETEEMLVIQAELPGVKKEDISIEVKDNMLTLKGERNLNKEIREENYYRRERASGKFQRTFNISVAIDPDKIVARHKDGVLEIKIPRSKEQKPTQIDIK